LDSTQALLFNFGSELSLPLFQGAREEGGPGIEVEEAERVSFHFSGFRINPPRRRIRNDVAD